jgi:hypothetical protein
LIQLLEVPLGALITIAYFVSGFRLIVAGDIVKLYQVDALELQRFPLDVPEHKSLPVGFPLLSTFRILTVTVPGFLDLYPLMEICVTV